MTVCLINYSSPCISFRLWGSHDTTPKKPAKLLYTGHMEAHEGLHYTYIHLQVLDN